DASPAEAADQSRADQRDAPFAVRHPRSARTDRVRDVRGDEHSAECDDRYRKQPEIPGHNKSGELVEAELGPLINAAFKRHPIAQINHDRGLRNVKKQNGEEPKEKVRLSELRRGADPARPDHKKNLRQNEIEKAERFLERFAMFFDAALSAIERDVHH